MVVTKLRDLQVPGVTPDRAARGNAARSIVRRGGEGPPPSPAPPAPAGNPLSTGTHVCDHCGAGFRGRQSRAAHVEKAHPFTKGKPRAVADGEGAYVNLPGDRWRV